MDPQALRQSLHFQSSEYRYVNLLGGTLGGTFGGTFWEHFWGNLKTNDIYKKKGPVFWTPKHYFRVCISKSTGKSIFWGALLGALLGHFWGQFRPTSTTWKPMTFTEKVEQFFGPPKYYLRVCISNHQRTGMSKFLGALLGALLWALWGALWGTI